jgi:predicted nucleotidyltransferase
MSWIDDVWNLLDRKWLASFAERAPDVVFATVSGAHLYGFASPDSDIDLRGAFLLPTEDLLGLSQPRETITINETAGGVELDFVAHDLRKFASMMIRHNGYVLEQLYSPLVVSGGGALEELREIGRGCTTRGLFRHYRGFANGRRKRLREPGATVKHLLYAYRVYMTGIRALKGGGIEANVNVLNQDLKLSQIYQLVARKQTGAENDTLKGNEVAHHERELDKLEAKLESAFDASTLPEEPTSLRALNDFIVGIRLSRSLV